MVPDPPHPEPESSSGTDPLAGAPGQDPAGEVPDLDTLRARIDEVDRRLVAALVDRARIVIDVGRSKRVTGTPIYAPDRESAVLRRVLDLNPGPLPDRTVEAIYRELMSGSFALEHPIRVAFLGPPGSHSHVAAVRHFGSSIELAGLAAIDEVFADVAAGRSTYGLVPYENSIGGGITDTLDAFPDHDVTVYAEALVEIRHALLAAVPADAIRRIHSKPQAFAQCRKVLAARFPSAELVAEASTSRAVMVAAEAGTEAGAAAIGSVLAGEIHGLPIVFERIEDRPGNITRFLVIARQAARPSGDDRTSVMFTTAHRPGALVDVLQEFRDRGLNLSHIEKRPSGAENWDYTFFVDLDAHREVPEAAEAMEAAKAHCARFRVLGSYPRATRIL